MGNLFAGGGLNRFENAPRPATARRLRPCSVFELRSRAGMCQSAIPGRFFSSSLPPLFVPGRFATLSYTAGVSHVR